MSPTIVVDLPMSPFCLVFTSHALQLCLVHTHLGLLYLLGTLTHYIMSLVVFFALKSTLPNINIVITAAFHSLKFAWYHFTFNLPIWLCFKRVSCREYMARSCLLIHSANLWLLIGMFRPFTFKCKYWYVRV